MGRTLDALRQSRTNGRSPANHIPTPPPSETSAAQPAEAVEEIPFIEVGGPGKVVEASPSVVATPAAKPVRTPPPVTKPLFQWVPGESESRGREAGPVTVAFQ